MGKPRVGRVAVWVDCECGAEVEFSDVDEWGSMISIPCDECGRRVEISVSVFAQMVARMTEQEAPA